MAGEWALVLAPGAGEGARVAAGLVLAQVPSTPAGDLIWARPASGEPGWVPREGVIRFERTPVALGALVLQPGPAGAERAVVLGDPGLSPWTRTLDTIPREDFSTRYRPLRPGEPGVTVRCGDQAARLIHASAQRWLILGYGGLLAGVDPTACRTLDPNPPLTPGQAVDLPLAGTFRPGEVVRLEPGRAVVRYRFGAQDQERAIALPDLDPRPSSPPPVEDGGAASPYVTGANATPKAPP